jgi:hypothetical protein
VVDFGEDCFDDHLIAEIFKHVTIKLFRVVNHYLSQHRESTDYVLLEELLECCGGYVDKRLRFYPFCKVFDYAHYIPVISLGNY